MTESRNYLFSQIGGALCLDFINTASWQASKKTTEHLTTLDELLRWASEKGICNLKKTPVASVNPSGNCQESPMLVQKALNLRQTLHDIFLAVAESKNPKRSDILALNVALAEAPIYLVLHQERGRFHCRRKGGEIENLLGSIAWSAADLLISADLRWVKRCANDTCGWLFVDSTKNHSRRWCDMADCGSREKAYRYYHRKKQQEKKSQKR